MPKPVDLLELGAYRWLTAGVALLLVIFTVEQVPIARINCWWIDELFSLWASDPHLRFGSLFATRIAPDSNPPLYFSALYFARVVIPHDQTAIYVLNLAGLAGAVVAVISISARTSMLPQGLLGAGLFLLSGPVLRYIPEARSYLLAIALVFVVSWYTGTLIVQRQWQPSLLLPVFLGAGAALTHLFAALACGVLAAGMLYVAIVHAHRHLAGQSIVLGLTASIVSAAWVGSAGAPTGNIGWIEFSPTALRVAVWELKELAFGSRIGLLAFAGLLALGLFHRTTRTLASAFCLAFLLFAALPLIVSLKTPIVAGRYWMIGMPMAIALPAFLAGAWYQEPELSLRWSWPMAGLLLAVLFFLSSSIGGFAAAHRFTAAKPCWKGANIVAPLVKSCPAGSVRVIGATSLYGLAAKLPPTLFVDANGGNVAATEINPSACPVIAWVEHVDRGDDYVDRVSDDELLRDLRLIGPARLYEIRRHGSGYVVIRRTG